MGGANWAPAARFLTSPSRVLEGVSGENGAPFLAAQLVKFRTPFSPAEPDFGPLQPG